MSLALRLTSAWETVEVGLESVPLFRTLRDLDVDPRLKIGVDSGGARELLVELADDSTQLETESTRGIRLLTRTERSKERESRFLVIRCADKAYFRIFAQFAADVAVQAPNARDPVSCALELLRTWRAMFGRVGRDKSEAFLCGVFGELDELLTLSRYGASAAATWTGPMNRPQDFIRGPVALEVKSSRSHANEVEIHGLEQLWATPFDVLALAVKHVATDPGGDRIVDLVDKLLSGGTPAEDLYGRLDLYDLSREDLESPSQPRFSLRSTRYLKVADPASVLTPDSLRSGSLPQGVSAVAYRLSLDTPGLRPMDEGEIQALGQRLVGP